MNAILQVLQRGPVIAVVCGSGQVTSAAAASEAELIFALNAGYYRTVMGVGSSASSLPFGNSNDQTENMIRQYLLPHAGNTPIVAGTLASDPTVELEVRFERLRTLGVKGIANWPCLGAFDGKYREAIEADELSIAGECEMLARARRAGFFSFGFVCTPDDARQFAESGVDALVAVMGLTRKYEDLYERRDQVQDQIRNLNEILKAARKSRPDLKVLVTGGAISTPEDLEQLFLHSSIHGYIGGSAFDRLPVENIISSTIRRFKSVLNSHAQSKGREDFGQLIGRSEKMIELFRLIERIAPYDVNVCIEGESGTGKELIATQIHRMSKRAQQAFVTLNCGAIPDSLLESELFGHEKGAFTGADRRRLGKFELAHHGTLFLDEIADLSPRGQVALLRAIQQGEITRVGADRYIPVDVRILTASNQPLAKRVEQGQFRADLYHRLNQICLIAPPLTERADDIPLLVNTILSRLQIQFDRKLVGISPSFQEKLRQHKWHGNVRELQHVLTRAALLEDGPVLEGFDFRPERAESSTSRPLGPLGDLKKQACRAAVRQALLEHKGNKSLAAAALNVSRKTLYAWIKELNLDDAAHPRQA